MKKTLGLAVALLTLVVVLCTSDVSANDVSANGLCVSDSGIVCGGPGECCFAGPTFCFTFDCDY